ncbi:hypothetical protein R1flu_002712 [Riccia fluitans]|uniref:Acyltransferase n=1 Tax=Riccia fluitans TaxID=41844 RepID=A0ABD1Y9W9_9MARC
MIPKWTTISTQLVEPDVKREPEWMECSVLDYLALYYKSQLFLYTPNSEGEGIPQIDQLTDSLSKALTFFYPLAGRLIREVRWEKQRLQCNNAGALFIHKRYNGVASELINEDNFTPTFDLSGIEDIQPHAPVYPPSGLPTLIIQVTDFECGSRCVNASFSHQVSDATSNIHFLRSWAEISRGQMISSVPVHDRSLLSPRKPSPVLDDGAPVRFLNNRVKEPPAYNCFPIPEEGMRMKAWELSKTEMEAVKDQGRRDCAGNAVIPSTADCLSAHLWRLMVGKRDYKPDDMVALNTYVDLRSRLKDFPPSYFGNCVISTSTMMTVRDLLSKSLGDVATEIRKSNQAVDDEVARGWIDWLSANKFHIWSLGDEPLMPGDPQVVYHIYRASYVLRAPFYDLDFGSGKPLLSFRNDVVENSQLLGTFLALPSSRRGDVRLELFAENSLLDKIGDKL